MLQLDEATATLEAGDVAVAASALRYAQRNVFLLSASLRQLAARR